jgi:selenoprotein W-related protein
VSLGTELLKLFEAEIESLALIPSDGGTFEVVVNERLLYSKLQTRRHAEPGEVAGLVRKFLREGT